MKRRADGGLAARRAGLLWAAAAVILAGCLGPAPDQVPVTTPAASPGSPTSTVAGATAPPGWLAAVCETLQPLQDVQTLLSELAAQGPGDPQRRSILAEALVDAILEAELEADLIPEWQHGDQLRGTLERMTAALVALVPALDAARGAPAPQPLASASGRVQEQLANLGSVRQELIRLAGPPPGCLTPTT